MRNEQEEREPSTPTSRRQRPRLLFPDLFSYDDPRTAEERVEDQRRVCRQVTNLTRRRQDDAFRSELIESLQRRRAGRDDPGLVQFDLIPGRAAGDPGTLVVRGQLLIRSEAFEDDSGLRRTLERSGFHPSPLDDCPELGGTVQRLENPDIEAGRLSNTVGFLRRQGMPASVNHIMPLGPVAKGLGGPENTSAARPFPQRQAAARQAAPAEGTGTPRKRTTVAVIDTGIDKKEHRDDGWLASVPRDGNIDPLDDFPQRGGDGFLDFAAGHGSFAAGVVQQVFPDVDLRVHKALDSDGLGDELGVACAMVRAVKDGARILNLSLGAQTVDDQPPVAIQAALELIDAQDVLVVAAAGNFGDTRPTWPAAFRRVISVASVTADLSPSEWSSRGFWVDCSTIGEGVFSTYVPGMESHEIDPRPDAFGHNAWAIWSGTSFAAPQVAGALARLCEHSGRTPREALRELLGQGTPVPDFGRAAEILPVA